MTARTEAEIKAEALYSARDALYGGEGPDHSADSDIIYGEWLGNRADRLATETAAHPAQPDAALSDDEAVYAESLRAFVLLSEEWDLTEFPDERTAMIMRADMHRTLEANAMRILAARAAQPVPQSWFREEYERAKERNEMLPERSRMIVTNPELSAHARAAHPVPAPEVCPTLDCPGDWRYAAPGRDHLPECHYPLPAPEGQVERLCEVMHDAYEAAAATEGWETQERSRKPWADVPEANKATMRAAVSALLAAIPAAPAAVEGETDTAAPEGEVGTGAGDGASGQVTGAAWVNRSKDCPEAPAQAHLPAAPVAVEGVETVEWREALAERVRRYVDQQEGMCWCGFDVDDSWGITLNHIAHSIMDDTTPVEPETSEPEGGESR